jgi:hypothetical protein
VSEDHVRGDSEQAAPGVGVVSVAALGGVQLHEPAEVRVISGESGTHAVLAGAAAVVGRVLAQGGQLVALAGVMIAPMAWSAIRARMREWRG